MRRPWQTWVVRTLWVLEVTVVGWLLVLGQGGSGDAGSIAGVLLILVFATTGLLVVSHVPTNPVGWLLSNTALCFTIGGLCEEVSSRAAATGDAGPLTVAAAWVGTFVWFLGLGPAATFVLLLFPDGHLPGPGWRWLAWLSAAALTSTTLASAVQPGTIAGTAVTNPFGVSVGAEAVVTFLEQVGGLLLLLVCVLLCCTSLVVRYRSADAEQRQQLKWLAWSLPVVVGLLGAAILAETVLRGEVLIDVVNALVSVAVMIVPIAIAVAIVRHRLYDIDVVIKRTLVYSTLTATLVATYLALVLVLQLLFSPVAGDSDVAVAASTLAVAALFGPLRTRIQRTVDRRFYRRRYDAAVTLHEFTGRLRQQVDLETTASDLRRVVHETVQPAHVSIWLRGRKGAAWIP